MYRIDELRDRLRHLLQAMAVAVENAAGRLADLPDAHRPSAENLLHYLCLRREDLTDLQEGLSAFGLSSLGRCEGAVLAHCQRVAAAAEALSEGRTLSGLQPSLLSNPRLDRAAEAALGPGPTRVMVTLDAADGQVERITTLLRAGMSIARINAGHGDADQWHGLIQSVRHASAALDLPCRILLDLPGPKIRIATMPDQPGIFVAKVSRDRYGRRQGLGRIDLIGGEGRRVLPLEGLTMADLLAADRLRFRDARGRRQELKIRHREGALFAEHESTLRLVEGTPVHLRRKGKRIADGRVTGLPPEPLAIRVRTGDALILVHRHAAHAGTQVGSQGVWRVPCTWDAIFAAVAVGQRVTFDDGRCSGVVASAGKRWLRLVFDQVPAGEATLRNDQGINLPDTEVTTPDLVDEDRRIMGEFLDRVDLFGCSFVQGPATIRAAREILGPHAHRVGLVAKIETLGGCRNLGDILLEGLRGGPFAVLVARGDLAVEVGFARLAEAQEEILWLCEAAHVPVIWGTQVLEKLAKKGLPTRAEVTDAAMASRAECVMLNKGAHVGDAIRFLHEVIPRVRDHLTKKRALLRPFPLPLSEDTVPAT